MKYNYFMSVSYMFTYKEGQTKVTLAIPRKQNWPLRSVVQTFLAFRVGARAIVNSVARVEE